MDTLTLFVFSSDTFANVVRGYEEQMWAVSRVDATTAAARETRSSNLGRFSRGLLYSSDGQVFTVPFRVKSLPENRVETKVWPGETWEFPFGIYPLGSPEKILGLPTASMSWPFMRGMRNPSIEVRGMSGLTVFAPNTISLDDWNLILKDLGTVEDEFPPPEEFV